MTDFGREVPAIWSGRFVCDHLTIVITLCAFVPMVVISALGWLYAGILHDVVPVELTNLEALRVLLAGMLHSSIRPIRGGP